MDHYVFKPYSGVIGQSSVNGYGAMVASLGEKEATRILGLANNLHLNWVPDKSYGCKVKIIRDSDHDILGRLYFFENSKPTQAQLSRMMAG